MIVNLRVTGVFASVSPVRLCGALWPWRELSSPGPGWGATEGSEWLVGCEHSSGSPRQQHGKGPRRASAALARGWLCWWVLALAGVGGRSVCSLLPSRRTCGTALVSKRSVQVSAPNPATPARRRRGCVSQEVPCGKEGGLPEQDTECSAALWGQQSWGHWSEGLGFKLPRGMVPGAVILGGTAGPLLPRLAAAGVFLRGSC